MNKRSVRKIDVSLSDHYWITVDDNHDATPLDCPICKILLCDKQDVLSYKNYECCKSCANAFVYPHREKWDKGWRPNDNQISSQREKRLSVPTYIYYSK